jgi:hypothetical protein
VILTDYAATKGVYNQTNLNTSDVSKANIRLVHASVYLLQFNLNVRHYLGRLNIVPDALSRLKATEQRDVSDNDELEHILLSTETIMAPKFKEKLLAGLWDDPKFSQYILSYMPT